MFSIGGTRTPDLLVRSQLLYPTELLPHVSVVSTDSFYIIAHSVGKCKHYFQFFEIFSQVDREACREKPDGGKRGESGPGELRGRWLPAAPRRAGLWYGDSAAAAAVVTAAVIPATTVVATAAVVPAATAAAGTAATEDDDQDQNDPQAAVTTPTVVTTHTQLPPVRDGDRLAISAHLMPQVPGCASWEGDNFFALTLGPWRAFPPGWSGWAYSTGLRCLTWWLPGASGRRRTGRRRAPQSCS